MKYSYVMYCKDIYFNPIGRVKLILNHKIPTRTDRFNLITKAHSVHRDTKTFKLDVIPYSVL